MTNAKRLEMSEMVLSELEIILKKETKLVSNLIKGKDFNSLMTDDFIVTYSLADYVFYISFLVGSSGKTVANYMRQILTIFEPNEVIILPDFFYDKVKMQLKHGYDAIEAKQGEILNNNGKEKCIMCDRVYPMDDITNGVCKYCQANQDKILWN